MCKALTNRLTAAVLLALLLVGIPGAQTRAGDESGGQDDEFTPSQVPGQVTGSFLRDPVAQRGVPIANINVLRFSYSAQGQQIGDGECTALAYQALRYARATKPNSTYVWGNYLGSFTPGRMPQTSIHPGDILQFEGAYFRKGSRWSRASHHTAVVAGTQDRGRILLVFHQNVSRNGVRSRRVQGGAYDFRAMQQGTVKAYRPIGSSGNNAGTATRPNAALCIRNDHDRTVDFDFRWRANSPWERFSLRPGGHKLLWAWRTPWQPEVRFVNDLRHGRGQKTVGPLHYGTVQVPSGSQPNRQDAVQYRFRRHPNDPNRLHITRS